MGLTIHYHLRCDARDATQVGRRVQQFHSRLGTPTPKRSGVKALPPTTDPIELARWATAWVVVRSAETPDVSEGIPVHPIEGRIFPVVIGQDCEPLWLGLCRYPATVFHRGRKLPTRLGAGWRFAGACKTQYASVHGWDHFYRCHTTAIALLREWTEFGARVRIVDEGGWWPHRSDAALRRALDTMNQTVAALAGAIKDVSEDHGRPPVASPIFSHPHFERLEAEGLARDPRAVRQAVRLVSDLPETDQRGDSPTR